MNIAILLNRDGQGTVLLDNVDVSANVRGIRVEATETFGPTVTLQFTDVTVQMNIETERVYKRLPEAPNAG